MHLDIQINRHTHSKIPMLYVPKTLANFQTTYYIYLCNRSLPQSLKKVRHICSMVLNFFLKYIYIYIYILHMYSSLELKNTFLPPKNLQLRNNSCRLFYFLRSFSPLFVLLSLCQKNIKYIVE